jgi:hypothetical protein
MNFLLRPNFDSRLLAGVLLILSCPLIAADIPQNEPRLVITNGNVTSGISSNRPVRATLRTIGDEIMRRYPTVTINIVGVEDVVVGDLTLSWPPRHSSVAEDDSTSVILAALVETMDTPTFSISRPAKNQFLLARAHGRERGGTPRGIDVFNLKRFLEGTLDKAALEVEVHQLELRLQTLNARYERIAGEIARGTRASGEQNEVKNELVMVKEHLQLAVKRLKRASPSKDETSKRLDQLIEVVRTTLAKLGSREEVPEFDYHAGTYLLVVIGSDAAIDVTRKVVTALEKSSD